MPDAPAEIPRAIFPNRLSIILASGVVATAERYDDEQQPSPLTAQNNCGSQGILPLKRCQAWVHLKRGLLRLSAGIIGYRKWFCVLWAALRWLLVEPSLWYPLRGNARKYFSTEK